MNAMTFDTFLNEALELPIEQRSRLATILLDSLDAEDSGDLSAAWKHEVLRRAGELDDGSVEPMSFEAFKNHVEARVAR